MKKPHSSQHGFTLLELMVVVVVLTLVMGVVFNSIAQVQQRYRTEDQRVDITQNAREYLDQIIRDLHQSGYPNRHLYDIAPGPPATLVAAGVVAVSATDILFEGDVDGTGNVNSVRYTLQKNANGNCPCTLSRSSAVKLGVGGPFFTPSYTSELNNVVNSTGSGTAYLIEGNAPNGTANDTMYGSLKTVPVFQYFDANNNPVVVPDDLVGGNAAAGQAVAATVYLVQVNINVLGPYPDARMGIRPQSAMRGVVRIGNQ